MTLRKLVYVVTIENGEWVAQIPVVDGVVIEPTLARLKASVIEMSEWAFEGEEYEVSYAYDLPLELLPEVETDRSEVTTRPGQFRRRLDAVRARLKELIKADVTEGDAAEIMNYLQRGRQLRHA